jgi:hypothetical protein
MHLFGLKMGEMDAFVEVDGGTVRAGAKIDHVTPR